MSYLIGGVIADSSSQLGGGRKFRLSSPCLKNELEVAKFGEYRFLFRQPAALHADCQGSGITETGSNAHQTEPYNLQVKNHSHLRQPSRQ